LLDLSRLPTLPAHSRRNRLSKPAHLDFFFERSAEGKTPAALRGSPLDFLGFFAELLYTAAFSEARHVTTEPLYEQERIPWNLTGTDEHFSAHRSPAWSRRP